MEVMDCLLDPCSSELGSWGQIGGGGGGAGGILVETIESHRMSSGFWVFIVVSLGP